MKRNVILTLLLLIAYRAFGLGTEILDRTPYYTFTGGIPVYTGFFPNSDDDEAGLVTIKAGYGNKFQQVMVDDEIVLTLDSPVSEIEMNLSKYVIGYENDIITHRLRLLSAYGSNSGELYFCRYLPEKGGCVLFVPATYKGSVIGVNPSAKNVSIPDEYWVTEEYSMSITSIEKKAFQNATEMETLYIPSELSSIQSDAFSGCTNLSEVTFADSENALKITNAHWLAPNLFPDSPIKKIYLGRTITNTDGSPTTPFYKLTTLEEIKFGSNPIELNNCMFTDCSSLKEIEIPECTTWPQGTAESNSTGPEGLFSGCSNLETVRILTKDVTSTANWMFFNCSSLKSVSLPDGIQLLSSGTFSGCESLQELPISNLTSLSTIGQYTFAGCSMEFLNLPEGITDINAKAFQNCKKLKTVILPTSLTTLGKDAFAYSENIREVFYLTDTQGNYNQYTFENPVYSYATLYLLENQIDILSKISPWANFRNIKGCQNSRLPFIQIKDNTIETNLSEDPESIEIKYEIIPQVLFDNNISWESSNPEIAEVTTENGIAEIGVKGIGNATITASLSNGNNAKLSINVLPILVESLSINPISMEAEEGDTFQIIASVLPEDATDRTLEWSSSDETVATVDETGLVSVLKEGECVITAKTTDGSDLSANCYLSVTTRIILAKSLSLNPISKEAEEGDSFQITATVLPEDATDKTLEWSSSDETVATVDETGLVSVLKEGECVITAKTTDGSDLTANCYLSATSGINNVSFDTDETVDVYSLDGVKVRTNCKKNEALNLPAGAYLLRKGNKVEKLIIR